MSVVVLWDGMRDSFRKLGTVLTIYYTTDSSCMYLFISVYLTQRW